MNWAGLLPLALMLFAMCDRAQEEVSLSVVEVGGAAFMVEIAASPDERSRGLSGRDRLPEGSGMLFVYNEPAVPGFWMRGMRFALDFVWDRRRLRSGGPYAGCAGARAGNSRRRASRLPAVDVSHLQPGGQRWIGGPPRHRRGRRRAIPQYTRWRVLTRSRTAGLEAPRECE